MHHFLPHNYIAPHIHYQHCFPVLSGQPESQDWFPGQIAVAHSLIADVYMTGKAFVVDEHASSTGPA